MLNQVQSIFELITAEKETVILDIIDNASNDPLCVRRETILFALAVYIRHTKSQKFKTIGLEKVSKICKTTDELFLFVKFAHILNKNFSNGIKKLIRNYYVKADPVVLQKIFSDGKSYYGWTHKDLIKFVHIKPANPGRLNHLLFKCIILIICISPRGFVHLCIERYQRRKHKT